MTMVNNALYLGAATAATVCGALAVDHTARLAAKMSCAIAKFFASTGLGSKGIKGARALWDLSTSFISKPSPKTPNEGPDTWALQQEPGYGSLISTITKYIAGAALFQLLANRLGTPETFNRYLLYVAPFSLNGGHYPLIEKFSAWYYTPTVTA